MAIAYTGIHQAGAVSVASANWSDTSGFAASAPKLLIRAGDENQTISGDLDQSGASNACDILHIIGGRPSIVGTANAPLKWKPDHTYTSHPNLIVGLDGGKVFIEASTNACTFALFYGKGEVNLVGGDFTTIKCSGPIVNVASACDVTTLAICDAGELNLESSGDTLPTLRAGGRGRVWCKRRVETAINMTGSCHVRQYNTTGSGTATLNLHGGIYIPEFGDVATINRDGGIIDISGARGAVALGGTAITNYGPGRFPSTQGNVTIGGGTTTDYAEFVSGGGVAVPGGK